MTSIEQRYANLRERTSLSNFCKKKLHKLELFMSLLYFVYVLSSLFRNKDTSTKNNSRLSSTFTFGQTLTSCQPLNFISKIETWMKWWKHFTRSITPTISKESMESTWMRFKTLLLLSSPSLSCSFCLPTLFLVSKKGLQFKSLSGPVIWLFTKSITISIWSVKNSPLRLFKCARIRNDSYKNILKIKTTKNYSDWKEIPKGPILSNRLSPFTLKLSTRFTLSNNVLIWMSLKFTKSSTIMIRRINWSSGLTPSNSTFRTWTFIIWMPFWISSQYRLAWASKNCRLPRLSF